MGSSVLFYDNLLSLRALGSRFPGALLSVQGPGPGWERRLGGVACAPCLCHIRKYSTAWGFQVRPTTPSPVVSVCGPCSLHPGGGRVSVELGLCAGRDITRRLLPESPPEAKLDCGLRNPFTDVSVFLPHM